MAKLLNIKNLLLGSKNTTQHNRLSAIIFALNLMCSFINAQNNLVPNGSFENYSICPNNTSQVHYATPWFQPNNPSAGPGGSSDFYNVCNYPSTPNVPFNIGFQYAKSGNGYAGITFYLDTSAPAWDWGREYLEIGLTDSLRINKKYCIRFFTVKSNWSQYAVKNIQAVLTNDSLIYNDINGNYITGVTPILEANSIIIDTLNWIPIEGIYVATGGERFLTIGNFNSGNTTTYQYVFPYSGVPNSLGYYLIDDVSIYEQPDIFAGNDTIIPPGDSTQLGTIGRADIIYSWSPTTGLNNPNIANPMTIPGSSISYTLTVTDTNQLACASVLIDTVLVQVGFIGINEFQNSNFGLQVYPNPFSEIITFKTETSDFYEIKIYDVVGKQLRHVLFEGKEYVLKNEELGNGIYFYEMKNKNGERARGKFLKK